MSNFVIIASTVLEKSASITYVSTLFLVKNKLTEVLMTLTCQNEDEAGIRLDQEPSSMQY